MAYGPFSSLPCVADLNQDNQVLVHPNAAGRRRSAEKDLSFSPSARLCVLRGWAICTNITWSDLVPHLPCGLSGLPQLIEFQVVLVCVHALPEAGVPVRHQLPFASQPPEKLALEGAVVVQVIEDLPVEDEETAVDPIGDDRLLLELRHGALVVKFQQAEVRARVDGGERGDAPVRTMELQQRMQIDVGQPVAVRHAERLVVADVSFDAFDAASGVGVEAGVGKCDAPVFADRTALAQLIITRLAHLQREIGVEPVVFEEVAFDRVAEIAQAENEIVQPVMGVNFHQMPEHGTAPDLDQSLGYVGAVFAQTRSAAARLRAG